MSDMDRVVGVRMEIETRIKAFKASLDAGMDRARASQADVVKAMAEPDLDFARQGFLAREYARLLQLQRDLYNERITLINNAERILAD